VSTDPQPSSARCAAVVAALMALALALRLVGIDFALPFAQEPDPHILGQIELLSRPDVTDEDIFFSSIYPHSFARFGMWTGAPVGPPADIATLDLAGQLHAAGGLHRHMRILIACLSVLIVPATFLLGALFLSRRWALVAAAFASVSTLSLQFGQMARPHAAAAPLTVLAIVACVHLRRHGSTKWFVLAGAACALAMGCLTNAFAVLIPAFLAFLLRNGVPSALRRVLEPRVLIPFALIALSIRAFYPFFFVPTPQGALMPSEEGTVSFGWQTFNWAEFKGAGFPVLFLTPWFYEPAASVLAIVGLLAWLITRHPSLGRERSERAKDLLVVLSFALAYGLVIGLENRNQQRFTLPLMPYLFCAAAFALSRLGDWLRKPALVGGLTFASLALPLAACLGFTGMRLRPHTLELLSQWITTNVDREHQRVGLHLVWDVPLPRRHENLFDAQGNARKVTLSPWLRYQSEWMDAAWKGERWDIEPLYPERERWGAILKDPGAYLDELKADFVVLPGGEGVGVTALTRALRAELARRGAKVVLELPAEERPPPSGREGLDTSHFTLYVLTSHWFGPQLEVYALPAR
jgi:hypothetical protein